MHLEYGWCDEVVAHLTVLLGCRLYKKVGNHCSKAQFSQSCQRVTTMKIIPQLPIWLPRWGSCGPVGQEVAQRDEWRWWERSIDGGWSVCSLAQKFEVCLWMCADAWTPNPNCHILLPAKHLAADQDNRLYTAKAKKHYILHWCISMTSFLVYLSLLRKASFFFLLTKK